PRDAAGNLNPPPGNDSELVAYPDVLRGEVTVASSSQFQGAAGRLRYNICCKEACGGCTSPGYAYRYGYGQRCGYPAFCRVDLTGGFRFYRLDESLTITEDLTSLQSVNPGRFEIFDRFETQNEFSGGEVGMMVETGVNRWTLDFLMRIAVGNVKQTATISGETTISPLTAPAETFTGGLLAQTSNIGTYSRDEFTMAPELGTNLGFYLTPRFRALVGYSFIYLGNVLRPGDQIDLDVNPDQLAPPLDPIVGPLRPEFVFRQTDYWAHGLNVSLDLRW
ncbi:MAG: BBP7 family outer membrane beta-barrel protein, partial [Planctomycetota bacterium]